VEQLLQLVQSLSLQHECLVNPCQVLEYWTFSKGASRPVPCVSAKAGFKFNVGAEPFKPEQLPSGGACTPTVVPLCLDPNPSAVVSGPGAWGSGVLPLPICAATNEGVPGLPVVSLFGQCADDLAGILGEVVADMIKTEASNAIETTRFSRSNRRQILLLESLLPTPLSGVTNIIDSGRSEDSAQHWSAPCLLCLEDIKHYTFEVFIVSSGDGLPISWSAGQL